MRGYQYSHFTKAKILPTPNVVLAIVNLSSKEKKKGNYIITAVTFKLTKRNHLLHTEYGAIQQLLAERGLSSPTPKQLSEVIISIRQSKLPNPDTLGNCGSFFKILSFKN